MCVLNREGMVLKQYTFFLSQVKTGREEGDWDAGRLDRTE